jgi:hypothetical protein
VIAVAERPTTVAHAKTQVCYNVLDYIYAHVKAATCTACSVCVAMARVFAYAAASACSVALSCTLNSSTVSLCIPVCVHARPAA